LIAGAGCLLGARPAFFVLKGENAAVFFESLGEVSLSSSLPVLEKRSETTAIDPHQPKLLAPEFLKRLLNPTIAR
jgi:hypothetical protein